MYLQFDYLRDVDTVKLLTVYDESDDSSYADLWDAANGFYEDLSLFYCCRGAFLSVLALAGRYVSAVRVEPYRDGYLLSCLVTAQNDRRKGYAALLLEKVMEKNPGIYYAHVDRRNRASLELHRKLGFAVYLDYAVHVDGSVYANSYTLRK